MMSNDANDSMGLASAAAAEPTPQEAAFLEWLRTNGAVTNNIAWPAITVSQRPAST